MSAVAIIKNVYQFARILSSASNVSVEQWDDKSIQNALNWADYCQELREHVRGKEYEEDLNHQLHQMTMLIEPVSCLRLSVDSLGQAKTLLVEALLSNSAFPKKSVEKLTTLLADSSHGTEVLHQVENKLKKANASYQLCKDVMKLMGTFDNNANDCDVMTSRKGLCQAQFLLQHLVMTGSEANKAERFESYCHALCDRLAETDDGWEILVQTLVVEVETLPEVADTWRTIIHTHFLTWLKDRAVHDAASCGLWNVCRTTLSAAACASDQFFCIYLDLLTSWADSFFPCVCPQDAALGWRSQHGHSTADFLRHLHNLLVPKNSLGEEKRKRVLTTVTEKVKTTDFTIWQDVVRQLLHVLKHG